MRFVSLDDKDEVVLWQSYTNVFDCLPDELFRGDCCLNKRKWTFLLIIFYFVSQNRGSVKVHQLTE